MYGRAAGIVDMLYWIHLNLGPLSFYCSIAAIALITWIES